jgi:hypothetical protein
MKEPAPIPSQAYQNTRKITIIIVSIVATCCCCLGAVGTALAYGEMILEAFSF